MAKTKIYIEINLETDGDLGICNFEDLYVKTTPVGPGNITFGSSDDEHFYIGRTFEDEYESVCQMHARELLADVLCNISFVSHHYWLIPEFYELFTGAIDSVNNLTDYHKLIFGNQDGTYVLVQCLKEQEG